MHVAGYKHKSTRRWISSLYTSNITTFTYVNPTFIKVPLKKKKKEYLYTLSRFYIVKQIMVKLRVKTKQKQPKRRQSLWQWIGFAHFKVENVDEVMNKVKPLILSNAIEEHSSHSSVHVQNPPPNPTWM